jgi:hypothetical protein
VYTRKRFITCFTSVNRRSSLTTPPTSLSLSPKITFDLEALFPEVFGAHLDIHTGYGSDQGFKAFADYVSRNTGECLRLSKELYKYVKGNASDDELAIMGLYRHQDGTVRYVTTNDRLLQLSDMEHSACSLYQMLAWTLAHRATNVAHPTAGHCHPSKTELAKTFFSPDILKAATGSMDAYARLVDSGLFPPIPEAFRLRQEDRLREHLDGLPQLRKVHSSTQPFTPTAPSGASVAPSSNSSTRTTARARSSATKATSRSSARDSNEWNSDQESESDEESLPEEEDEEEEEEEEELEVGEQYSDQDSVRALYPDEESLSIEGGVETEGDESSSHEEEEEEVEEEDEEPVDPSSVFPPSLFGSQGDFYLAPENESSGQYYDSHLRHPGSLDDREEQSEGRARVYVPAEPPGKRARHH